MGVSTIFLLIIDLLILLKKNNEKTLYKIMFGLLKKRLSDY